MANRRIRDYITATILTTLLIWILLKVFSGTVILPQTIAIGPLTIRIYGIVMALAVGAGYWMASRRVKQYGIDEKKVDDILFWVIVGGLLGARLYHVASSLGYYWNNPVDIMKIWNGGLSIYGAVLGGIVSLYLCRKIFNFQYSIFKLLDWLTPSVIIGQVIGRFGNLFNYELFGFPTGVPWKMYVPVSFRPEEFINAEYFHPLFFYESLFLAGILAFFLKYPSRFLQPGQLFFAYLFLYNVGRFFLEFIRIDSVFAGGIRLNAAVSLITAALSALVLIKNYHGKVP